MKNFVFWSLISHNFVVVFRSGDGKSLQLQRLLDASKTEKLKLETGWRGREREKEEGGGCGLIKIGCLPFPGFLCREGRLQAQVR